MRRGEENAAKNRESKSTSPGRGKGRERMRYEREKIMSFEEYEEEAKCWETDG